MADNVVTVNSRTPHLAGSTWIAATATVVGDVTIGPGSGIFYGAVVRADREAIPIGENSNVPDTAVLHGCTVENGSLIGMNTTFLNDAVIGTGSLVAANSLVLEGTVIPPRSLVAGVPAKVRRELTDAEVGHCRANAATYETLTTQHATPTTIGQPA